MRITNESEYRAWEVSVNGLTRRSVRADEGTFGVINLLAPRPSGFQHWHEQLTYATMRFDLIDRGGAAITLARTFITFFGAPHRRSHSCSRQTARGSAFYLAPSDAQAHARTRTRASRKALAFR
jgi:hypothetical protein